MAPVKRRKRKKLRLSNFMCKISCHHIGLLYVSQKVTMT